MKDYLFKQANEIKYSVILNKLNKNVIVGWKPKPKETWQDIDPYSDLKDIGDDTGNDNDECQNTSTEDMPNDIVSHQNEDEAVTNCYGLRARKTKTRVSDRPSRRASRNISYRNAYDGLDLPRTLKRPKLHKCASASGPSVERIAARGNLTVHSKMSHLVPVAKS